MGPRENKKPSCLFQKNFPKKNHGLSFDYEEEFKSLQRMKKPKRLLVARLSPYNDIFRVNGTR